MQQDHTPPRNNIPAHTVIAIDGVEKIYRGYTGQGRHDIADAVTGASFVMQGPDGSVGLIGDDQFADLIESELLEFRPVSPTARARLLTSVARYTLEDALRIDPAAEKRLVVCDLLDGIGCMNGTKAVAIGLHAVWTPALEQRFGPMPPAGTVRRWRSERGRPGRRHARDMVSNCGRTRRRSSLAEPVEETLQKHALERNATGSSIRAGYAMFLAEVQRINAGEHPTHAAPDEPYDMPSKRTFRRRCDALEQSRTVAAGRGKAAVEQFWDGGGRSLTADYALHRIIIDHTPLDAHAVSDDLEMVLGRPWLTIAIDVFTRAIVGWVLTFMDPSVWTVAEVLKRISLPKRPPSLMQQRYPILRHIRGKPTEIILDNAAEFTSHNLEAAARAAGLSIRWCPIRKPRYRGVGERIFRTINTWACDQLPGRVLPPAETRRLGYDPEQFACVLMEEIEADLNQVIAEYNTDPHDALDQRQPALVFEREAMRRGIDVWADFEGFRLDMLPVEDGAQLSPGGIRAFGTLRYAGKREVVALLDDLVAVEGRRQRRDQATATVSYRYDPLDISKIHVWNRVKRQYVTLTSTDERYSDGMPLAFHEQLRADALSQSVGFNTEAEREAFRARRIHAIRQISPAAGARARKAVAELYEAPRIRQITGNIVDLRIDPGEAVSIGDFIAHDRAALTAFDVEVRSPRSPRSKRPPSDREIRRDSRDAGKPTPHDTTVAPAAKLEPRRRRGAGEVR